MNIYDLLDLRAIEAANKIHRRNHSIQCAAVTYIKPNFRALADGTALASSAAEGSLMTGYTLQPTFLAGFWSSRGGAGKSIKIYAAGVFSNTGTPTLIFQLRLGTTQGAAYLSGTSVGVSAAITTTSTVTNVRWELEYTLTCRTAGQGTNATTLSGSGFVSSPAGFATPFKYAIPTAATWTFTIDDALSYYLNTSATWSASSSSNTITQKDCQVDEGN